MMMKIEHELGPFCEGIRSVNWQVAKKPPIRVLEDRVKVLKAKRKYYLEEIKVHQKTLDKHTK